MMFKITDPILLHMAMDSNQSVAKCRAGGQKAALMQTYMHIH